MFAAPHAPHHDWSLLTYLVSCYLSWELQVSGKFMLDIKFIREHTDLVKKGAQDKRFSVDIDLLLSLDQELRPIRAH